MTIYIIYMYIYICKFIYLFICIYIYIYLFKTHTHTFLCFKTHTHVQLHQPFFWMFLFFFPYSYHEIIYMDYMDTVMIKVSAIWWCMLQGMWITRRICAVVHWGPPSGRALPHWVIQNDPFGISGTHDRSPSKGIPHATGVFLCLVLWAWAEKPGKLKFPILSQKWRKTV